jgi:hypothetical protein
MYNISSNFSSSFSEDILFFSEKGQFWGDSWVSWMWGVENH